MRIVRLQNIVRVRKLSTSNLICHKSTYVNRELLVELEKSKNERYILFLQEPGNTYIESNDELVNNKDRIYRITSFPRCNTFYSATNIDGPPRAAISADKSQDLIFDTEFSDRDITTCRWRTTFPTNLQRKKKNRNKGPKSHQSETDSQAESAGGDFVHTDVYICSLYWPCDQREIPAKLVSLMEFCTDKSIPLIVAGDSNAHSYLWHDKIEDNRGKDLEDLILIHDMTILNNTNEPTFERGNASSCIDISMVSNSIAKHFLNWRICQKDLGSDHKLITFTQRAKTAPTPLKRNLRKVDWSIFTAEVDSKIADINIPPFWNVHTMETMVKALYNAINEALDVAAPKTKAINRHRLPWWSDELANSRKERDQAHRAYKKNKNQQNYTQLRDKNRQNCRSYRKACRKHWQKTTTEVEDTGGLAKLVKGIRKGEIIPPTLLRRDDSYTKTREETAKLLLDTHFPESVDDENGELNSEDILEHFARHSQLSETLPYLTPDKVKLAIESFKDFKAAGPDEIKPVILKHLPNAAINMLSFIYTACIKLSYVPQTWQKSRTVFIPKTGKRDYTLARSYRPISLTSFCFKTLERLILWHLECTTFKEYPIHKKQHAFRKGRSTEGPLSQFTNYVEEALKDRGIAMAVFIDIEGAFDNLQTLTAVNAMRDHHMPIDIIKWYEFYLNNRFSTVSLTNKKVHRKIVKGTPQGGVLSPILWNMAFDSLLNMFNNDFVQIHGFADDACLVLRGTNPFQLRTLMQNAIRKVETWATMAGLRLSTSKTLSMIFSRSRYDHWKDVDSLRLYGEPIKQVQEARYLGLYFDIKLSWTNHLMRKCKSAIQLFFLLRNALGIMWGPSPHLIKWIYTGMMRPALTYGCFIWGKVTDKIHWKAKFRRLNALILRMMCPQRKSTPIATMELLTYIPPIDIFVKGEIVKSFYRNRHLTPMVPPDKGHVKYARELSEDYLIPNDEVWDRGKPELNFDKTFSIDESSFKNGLPVKADNSIVTYTDGSKIDDKVGCGNIIYYYYDVNEEPQTLHQGSYGLKPENTVFQAEIAAIREAAITLIQLSESQQLPPNVYIISDSLSAIQALNKYTNRSLQINNCIKILNKLGSLTVLTIRWIKAHAGHEGNEKADELAKAGAKREILDDPDGYTVSGVVLTDIPAPWSKLKALTNEGLEKEWAERFVSETNADRSQKHRQSKYFITKPDKAKSKALLKLNRNELSRVIQFTTGHAWLRRHESLIQISEGNLTYSPLCSLCQQGEETPFHLVHECDSLYFDSIAHLQAPRHNEIVDKNNYTLNWSTRGLLGFLRTTKIDKLFTKEDEEPPDPGGDSPNSTLSGDLDNPDGAGDR